MVDMNEVWNDFFEMKKCYDDESKDNVNTSNQCKNCKKETDVEYNSKEGDMVCRECGTILRSRCIDNTPEWRSYSDNMKNNTRCSMSNDPMLQGILHTYIRGNSPEAIRLTKIHIRYALRYDDRKMVEARNMFKEYGNMFNLTEDVMNHALILYKNLSNKKDKDGKRIIHRANVLKGLIGACIYYACKKVKHQSAKTPEDIAKKMEINTSHVNNGCNKLMNIMGMHEEYMENHITHRDFIPKFRNSFTAINIDISYSLMSKCNELADRACELGYMIDYTPQSIAAGVIWYIIKNETDLKVTMTQMKLCCKVSDVTITKVYKDFLRIKYLIEN